VLLALFAYRPGMLIGIAAIVAWAVCWVIGAADVFRRRDLGAGEKVVWLLVLLFLPLLGLFVYYLASAMRPPPR
jgi:hypothetical protein